jgi:hypothetical protein
MRPSRRALLTGSLAVNLILLAALLAPLRLTGAQSDARYFPETHHTVRGVFLSYWTAHGGLAQQGYPLTEEFQEQNKLNGKTYTVQYFERAVFELHPENQPPFNVLLSQLGKCELDARYPNGCNPAAAPVGPPGGGPVPTQTPAPPTALPASGQIDLLQSANYKDSIGTVWFVGVAKNNTGKQLSGAQIVLTLLDASGKIAATAESSDYTYAPIPAGAVMPFKILVSNAPVSWAGVRWQFAPRAYDPAGFLEKSYYRALALEDVQIQPPASGLFSEWTLVGQVHNTGGSTAQYVNIRAAVYDAGGALLDVNDGFAKLDPIPPGATSPFSISFSRDGIQPAKQDVFVDGRIK